MKDNYLRENERFDDLEYNDLKIIQNKNGYKFSTDSVLLSNFGKAKQSDIYVDLCSGSGVVAILFSCKNKIKKSFAVEVQPELADMANRSLKFNKLDDRITIIQDDLSNTHKILGFESVDVVTVNPPYNVVGLVSETDQIAVATHEIKTNLKSIIDEVSKLLKYGGKLYMVHRCDRLAEIFFELKKYSLEPKVMRVVYPKANKEPNLVLIEAKKGAKIGLKIMSPLVLNNDDGTETQELKEIYCRKI